MVVRTSITTEMVIRMMSFMRYKSPLPNSKYITPHPTSSYLLKTSVNLSYNEILSSSSRCVCQPCICSESNSIYIRPGIASSLSHLNDHNASANTTQIPSTKNLTWYPCDQVNFCARLSVLPLSSSLHPRNQIMTSQVSYSTRHAKLIIQTPVSFTLMS